MNFSGKELREITQKILKKERVAISRLISLIEDHHPQAFKILSSLYPKTGRIYKIGITGFPGAGKSTLINHLAKFFLSKKKKVGIVLVDPTSPLTGGAVLGDRIRLKDIQTHPDVFIRSMASRGGRGGLAQTTRYVVDVLDAAGFDVVLIETVGVGQLEIDIAHAAHETVAVLTPEGGDEVQAMKAGLMEVASLFVVNKIDRDKDQLWFRKLKNVLETGAAEEERKVPPVFPVSALYRQGMEAFIDHLWQGLKRFQVKGPSNDDEKVEHEIRAAMEEIFLSEVLGSPEIGEKIQKQKSELLKRRKSPYEIAKGILRGHLK